MALLKLWGSLVSKATGWKHGRFQTDKTLIVLVKNCIDAVLVLRILFMSKSAGFTPAGGITFRLAHICELWNGSIKNTLMNIAKKCSS